jgi:hypothetical protein
MVAGSHGHLNGIDAAEGGICVVWRVIVAEEANLLHKAFHIRNNHDSFISIIAFVSIADRMGYESKVRRCD